MPRSYKATYKYFGQIYLQKLLNSSLSLIVVVNDNISKPQTDFYKLQDMGLNVKNYNLYNNIWEIIIFLLWSFWIARTTCRIRFYFFKEKLWIWSELIRLASTTITLFRFVAIWVIAYQCAFWRLTIIRHLALPIANRFSTFIWTLWCRSLFWIYFNNNITTQLALQTGS